MVYDDDASHLYEYYYNIRPVMQAFTGVSDRYFIICNQYHLICIALTVTMEELLMKSSSATRIECSHWSVYLLTHSTIQILIEVAILSCVDVLLNSQVLRNCDQNI